MTKKKNIFKANYDGKELFINIKKGKFKQLQPFAGMKHASIYYNKKTGYVFAYVPKIQRWIILAKRIK